MDNNLPCWYDKWKTTDPFELEEERYSKQDDYGDYLAEMSDLLNSEINY